MNRFEESDLKKAEHEKFLEEPIDMLFEELSFAIEWHRPSILLVFYESEYGRAKAELALKKRLAETGNQMVQIKVDERHFDIPLRLSRRPDRAQSVYSVIRLSSGGGKAGANAYRALNMRREYFVDYAIRVIIWLAGDEAIELSRHAPDFWAFRHRVVELKDTYDQEGLTGSANELYKPGQGIPGAPEKLDEEIELYEALIKGLPKHAESYSARLDPLSILAALYQAKRAYDQSIRRLKQGIVIAKQVNNIPVLARFWGNLGSVYLDSDQLPRAIRAYRKAIRLYPQEIETWTALGHTYRIEKRLSDAIIAYKEAIRLDPQNSLVNSSLLGCYRLLGKDDLAEERRKVAQPIVEKGIEYSKAVFESVCGNTSKAIKLLASALEKRQVGLNAVRHDPNFDFIRADPRFEKVTGLRAPTLKDY
jgi:tetratricopeptide (TPR) repeat protein